MMTESPQASPEFFDMLIKGIDFTMPASGSFPMALWRDLAGRGLLNHFSGGNTSYRDIASAGLLLTRHSAAPGLTMTWLGQLLKLGFLKSGFLKHAGEQAYDCVQEILAGEALCSLAISEPGAGAHPKHLSCTATLRKGRYEINGEKAWVSHGPYADWFIVLAITDVIDERKQFSAFLIHKSQAGMELGSGEQSARLAPSSHCNISFRQCQVPETALIGIPGQAFEEISKPMRTLEDVLMLAPIAGAIQVQLDLLASHGKAAIDPDVLGRCLCLADSVAELGLVSAEKLDQSTELPDLTTLITGTRALISEVQSHIQPLLHLHCGLETLFNDIQLLTSIGQGATQARIRSLAERSFTQASSLRESAATTT